SLLKEGYLAVFISVGASDPRALGIPGEELPGVFHALEFLLAANLGEESAFGRKGRQVVVIGGGDVAMDAARSSLRLANKGDVTVVYRRARGDMPAGEEELTEGEAEGIQFLYSRAPVRILGKEQVEGIVVQQTTLSEPDAQGKRKVIEMPNTEETLSCDTVIVAVGEKAALKDLPPELGLKVSAQGWPEGTKEDWMTDVDGVFATGGKSIVYAMGAGTKAAEAIDAYVSKKTGGQPMPRPDPFGGPTPRPSSRRGTACPPGTSDPGSDRSGSPEGQAPRTRIPRWVLQAARGTGKSCRKCPPRLSSRARAPRAMNSAVRRRSLVGGAIPCGPLVLRATAQALSK
ncbi:glutamate synthase (NADPH), homotetrameric, partial [mine drainage metagenome]